MTISSYLKGITDSAIIRDSEKESIKRSIVTIESRLKTYFGGEIANQFIFGSYPRVTILPRLMDQNSDIDYMVVFSEDLYSQQTYLDKLRKFVNIYYSTSEQKQSHPTIRLKLNHITFELVPATKEFWSGSYKIPSLSNEWISTNPNSFNASLIEKNKSHGNLIKPLVRLMKYWNAVNGYIFDSYKLEQYVVERNLYGTGFMNSPDLKAYFFQCIEELGTWSLSQNKCDKVNRAKNIIAEVKQFEANNCPINAESKIKKLMPEPVCASKSYFI